MNRVVVLAGAAALTLLAAPGRAAELHPCPEATVNPAPCERVAPPAPAPRLPASAEATEPRRDARAASYSVTR